MGSIDFSYIQDANLVPKFKNMLEQNKVLLNEFLSCDLLDCHKLLSTLDEMDGRIGKIWYSLKYLISVADTDELQAKYHEIAIVISEYAISMGQNKNLFNAIIYFLKNSSNLSAEQIEVLKKIKVTFKLAGIDLTSDQQKLYQKVQMEHFGLIKNFEMNVLNDSAEPYTIKDVSDLEGLPLSIIDIIRTANLNIPINEAIFQNIMNNVISRELREAYYLNYINRASKDNAYNNTNNIKRLIDGRHKIAHILNFNNYTEFLTQSLTFNNTQEILDLLQDIVILGQDNAIKELNELQNFAFQLDKIQKLEAWDLAYYARLYTENKLGIVENILKEYLPLKPVLNKFLLIIEEFFGVKFVKLDNVFKWDEEVIGYQIIDNNNSCIGVLYFDLFTRPKKVNLAWTEAFMIDAEGDGDYTTPVAVINCNFVTPINHEEYLLTRTNLRILFHEIGHGLHHIFARNNYAAISGMNGMLLDVSEVYSLFFEKFCWQKEVLAKITIHYKTQKPMSYELIDKICKYKEYPNAIGLMQRTIRAIFDIRIHSEENTYSAQILLDHILNKTKLPKEIIDFNPNNFSLIFSNGYASRYYGYIWSEIIASNILEYFLEHGLYNKKIIDSFKQNLLVNNPNVSQAFFNFSNRQIDVNALFRQRNIY